MLLTWHFGWHARWSLLLSVLLHCGHYRCDANNITILCLTHADIEDISMPVILWLMHRSSQLVGLFILLQVVNPPFVRCLCS